MSIETDIKGLGIPIDPNTCIGDSLPVLNNSFLKLALEGDRTNNTLALTASNIQNQLNIHTSTLAWHDSRILALSAPLSGAVVSTKNDLFTTTYNLVVPSNKGGAGTINGILSALGTGQVVQARGTPSTAEDNNVVPDAEYVTPKYLIEKLKYYTRGTQWTEDANQQTSDLDAVKSNKLATPIQSQWPSSNIVAGYLLTYDPTVNKGSSTGALDKWVPRPPAAPPLVGAITGDANFNTTYNQVVPANKGGAGTLNGILSAVGTGTVVRARPSIDYLIPSDLSPYATIASLITYAQKTWVLDTLESYATTNWVQTNYYNKTQSDSRYYTKIQTDGLLDFKINNPLINPVTGNLFTATEAQNTELPGINLQTEESFQSGSLLTLVSWNSGGKTGKTWVSKPPAAPDLVGAILCDNNFNTTYNQVVPANKGGAGAVNGILSANGSGTVTAADEGEDYLTQRSAGWYSNYIPVSSLRIATDARNNSLIKYDDFNKVWRVASPEDEPFAEVNFITGLASQSGGWYSGCAFSERRVIAWGQIDGKGVNDRYKFSKTTATNALDSPSNYLFIPFHSEYDTNGNVGNNLHWFDLVANKKAYIKEVVWNWSCAMAWTRDDSKSGDGSSENSPIGGTDRIWVMGKHRTRNESGNIDNTTGSIGIAGNGGGVNKQTCGFVEVTLTGFPRKKLINAAGNPNNGKWVREQIVKIQCKSDPGIPPGAKGDDVPPGRDKTQTYDNYILWGALTNFGNLYVWGRSKDGCFGTGKIGGSVDIQLDTPTLINSVATYDPKINSSSNVTFAGNVIDFEYTGSEYEGTCLGIITDEYDSARPEMYLDVNSGVPRKQLWFAGDNQYYQQGTGTKKINNDVIPYSNDYFNRACKLEETGDSNQYGLCNQVQINANAQLQPTYVDNAKKIVRSQYGGRQANGYIDVDGRLWMCGSNQYGLLGNCGYIAKYIDTKKPPKTKTVYSSWGNGFYYEGIDQNTKEYQPKFIQEYPFRTSNTNNTSFKGKGFFCEARVETWQDYASVSNTNPNGISQSIAAATATFNKHQTTTGIGPMLELEREDRINAFYSKDGYTYSIQAVGPSQPRKYGKVYFEDAIICGLRAPYLIALGKISHPAGTLYKNSSLSGVPAYANKQNKVINNEYYGQYNLYGCGQNDKSHGYLGIDADSDVIGRLMPAVFKREVLEDDDDPDNLGKIVLAKVTNAKKIYTSDTNGNVNVERFTKVFRVQVSSDTYTSVSVNMAKYTYLSLGANAYVSDNKQAYICGYKTFNDPPDYDSEAYQYYTRLPIQRVEEMVLGGDLNQHTYQFFRTSPGIVWGMGEGQSGVIGPSNACYTPARII